MIIPAPIGASEKYAAKVFGAHRTYHVTNGSSTSNRVIFMACVTHNQVALCDRNCHKSIEQAMTMSGAIPNYMMPLRNFYGIIGPIPPQALQAEAIKKTISENSLITKDIDSTPVHAIVTNSTYDGLCYNARRVEELLGQSVDRQLLTKHGMAMPASILFIKTALPCTAILPTTNQLI